MSNSNIAPNIGLQLTEHGSASLISGQSYRPASKWHVFSRRNSVAGRRRVAHLRAQTSGCGKSGTKATNRPSQPSQKNRPDGLGQRAGGDSPSPSTTEVAIPSLVVHQNLTLQPPSLASLAPKSSLPQRRSTALRDSTSRRRHLRDSRFIDSFSIFPFVRHACMSRRLVVGPQSLINAPPLLPAQRARLFTTYCPRTDDQGRVDNSTRHLNSHRRHHSTDHRQLLCISRILCARKV